MKKIQGQLRYEVRTPPRRTPTAAPLPDAAPQIPSATLRSRPSEKVVISSERPGGAKSAPPRPSSARKEISDPSDQAKPQSTEVSVKIATPAMKMRRRPRRSERRPPRSRKPPKTIA